MNKATPATPARPAVSAKDQYARTAASLDSSDVTPDSPTQDVSIAAGVSAGIALPDVLGIESEPDTPKVKAALTLEQFMQQKLDVMFTEPANEHEAQFFEAGVNGEKVCIPRDGNIVSLKRCFVAIAAQSKWQRLKQTKIVNEDGSMGYREQAVLQQTYPFQVVNDPSGAVGVTWLRQLLQRS